MKLSLQKGFSTSTWSNLRTSLLSIITIFKLVYIKEYVAQDTAVKTTAPFATNQLNHMHTLPHEHFLQALDIIYILQFQSST